jgi:hypothetical protein
VRAVTIDLARGADQSIDPRVAPQGTVARAQNVRIDALGRLVARRGYTSLGTTVQGNPAGGAGTLEAFDLHKLGDDLIALGKLSSVQTGIRGAFRYAPTARGVWSGTFANDVIDDETSYMGIAPADSVRVLLSELAASQADDMWCDVAVDSTGVYVALATSYEAAFLLGARVTVVDRITGKVMLHQNQSSLTNPLARNVRILAIGTVFYLFEQVTTNIQVRTWDSASATQFFGAATTIATGVSAIPARYDVAAFTGSADYLIAFPTATGYTWRRFNSANVQQTTTSVVSLADAPVGIQGASGETVNVVNIRTGTGVELRTFNTAGALTVGPTDVSGVAQVFDWCSVSRLDAATVQIAMHRVFTGQDFSSIRSASTAAHALVTMPAHDNCKFVSKIALADGEPFIWETLGSSDARPFGLTAVTRTNLTSRVVLAAVALDGAAPTAYAALTAPQKSALVRGSGARYYVGVITLDPRDKTYRSNVIECQIFSGERRQGVESGGALYLAGGCVTQYDKRSVAEIGFETVPNIDSLTESTLGSLTALGTYTWQIVYRSVGANGEVTQSSPSAPATLTLTGVNNRAVLICSTPYSIRGHGNQQDHGVRQFIDVYRTEAGGSIPRLVKTEPLITTTYGAYETVSDGIADSVQQSGSALYTQGADGSVSGRLPLGFASPCELVAESDGKLILGGLERDTQLQLSIENRPGEAVGFVNDDLFFVQNPERVTGIVAGSAGRRLIFSPTNIRELVGPGPNAAGVGDISEPVEIENRVGCIDWRSIAKTEHGVFFQTSAFGKPRIYLMPEGGSSALDASQGITDLLELFPVITSATRHDEEQLLTFTLQNSAGTDGRILHLDLKTSGLTKNGWVGRWLIDRVQAFEAAPLIEIVEETIQVSPFEDPGALSIPLPKGKRLGDRLIVVICAQVATTTFTTPTSYTLLSNVDSTAGTVFVFERLLSSTAAAQSASLSTTLGVNSTAIVVKTWLLRGAHASQAAELTSVVNAAGASLALPTLTPSWGAADTLWLSLALNDSAFPVTQGVYIPLWRGMPASFERYESRSTTEGGILASALDVATASRQLNAASLGSVTWTSAISSSAIGLLIGVRPLANSGTPVRAATTYRGRLVLCNSTDVMLSDPAANGDAGSLVVSPELELADIYPMGIGGEGRHLRIGLLVEVLGACLVTALCSYDNGVNWTSLRGHSLDGVSGYHPGQVVRLQWTPPRRKIQGVRVKFTVSEDFQLAAGATGGVAMLQAQLFFEDLAGPSRVSATNRGVLAT